MSKARDLLSHLEGGTTSEAAASDGARAMKDLHQAELCIKKAVSYLASPTIAKTVGHLGRQDDVIMQVSRNDMNDFFALRKTLGTVKDLVAKEIKWMRKATAELKD